jgi:PhnB protein
MSVSYQAKHYHAITPYMTVSNAEEAIAHAEIQIGDSRIMLSNEYPDHHAYSPLHYKGTSVKFMVYVPNVDQAMAQAVEAGMEVVMPATDMFYGDRCGNVKDPYGFQWSLATHIEDVPQEEAQKRYEAWLASMT